MFTDVNCRVYRCKLPRGRECLAGGGGGALRAALCQPTSGGRGRALAGAFPRSGRTQARPRAPLGGGRKRARTAPNAHARQTRTPAGEGANEKPHQWRGKLDTQKHVRLGSAVLLAGRFPALPVTLPAVIITGGGGLYCVGLKKLFEFLFIAPCRMCFCFGSLGSHQ